jgi:hypothetical protein
MSNEINESEESFRNLIVEYIETLDCNEYIYVCNMLKNDTTRNMIIDLIKSKLLDDDECDIENIVAQVEMQMNYF